MENLTDSEIRNATDGLQKSYHKDLESYLYEELVQFNYLLNEKCWGINEAKRDLGVSVFKKGLGVCVFKH